LIVQGDGGRKNVMRRPTIEVLIGSRTGGIVDGTETIGTAEIAGTTEIIEIGVRSGIPNGWMNPQMRRSEDTQLRIFKNGKTA
jgi:hypothetical protein